MYCVNLKSHLDGANEPSRGAKISLTTQVINYTTTGISTAQLFGTIIEYNKI